nr:aldehyde dehydrogenase family protein [Rhizobium sp.]
MLDTVSNQNSVDGLMLDIGRRARAAARPLATASTDTKNKALLAMADSLAAAEPEILAANALDLKNAANAGLAPSLVDRLTLNSERIAAIARSMHEIADLADPVGTVITEWDRPNGLHIERVRTPLGVIGVIYESRPNVTADAGALCLKAGNAVILRGGSDSAHSSRAIHACLVKGLQAAGLPADAIQ